MKTSQAAGQLVSTINASVTWYHYSRGRSNVRGADPVVGEEKAVAEGQE